MKFKERIIDNKKDLIAIGTLLIILSTITYFLLSIDMKIGAYYVRDVFSYLNNALSFGGYESGLSASRGLSPVIPFITSIFFRLGFISDGTIMIVSSLFYIIMGIGTYCLFRLRFNELISSCGTIILATFPINLVWVSKGMLDIPGLALSIWTIYFMILGMKKDSKFFLLTFPLFIVGFFTRYTVALILPVILIMVFLMENPFKTIKKKYKSLVGGFLSGGICLAIFIIIYKVYNLPLFFLSQTESISSTTSASSPTTNILINNNLFYYLKNLPIYLGTHKWIPYSLQPGTFLFDQMKWAGGYPSIIAYLYLVILVIGIALYLRKLFSKRNRKLMFETEDKKVYVKLAIFLTSLIVFLISFTKISIIYSLIIISISLLSLYRILYKADIKYMKLDFIFFYWGIINFIFYTFHISKVDRYAISFTPSLTYFIILSLYLIYNYLKTKYDNKKLIKEIKTIVPVGLIVILLLFTGIYCAVNEAHTFDNKEPSNMLTASQDEKDISNWLKQYDPNYKTKIIWADRGGDMSFYLQMNIPSLDKISNKTNFTSLMKDNNVTYYISKDNKTNIIHDYILLKQFGEVSLYKIN